MTSAPAMTPRPMAGLRRACFADDDWWGSTRTPVTRFDPRERRVTSGPHAGEWTKGGAPGIAGAKAFLDKHYSGWRESLSPAQDKGLRFYQSPGFALMNGLLRGLDPGKLKASEHASDGDLDRARKATKDLTAAIRKAPPLPRDVTAYRGMDPGQFGKLTVGQVISDPAFVSTSLTKGAGAVGRAAKSVEAEVHLPAGTRAAGGSARELILAPGSRFRVASVKPLRLELITSSTAGPARRFDPRERRDPDVRWTKGAKVGSLLPVYNARPGSGGHGQLPVKGTLGEGGLGRERGDTADIAAWRKGHPVAPPITATEARDGSRPVSADEFQNLAREGVNRLGVLSAQRHPPTGLDDHWAQIKADTWGKVQQSWGGATIKIGRA